ncbi:nucleotide-sugar transporter [Microdochium bolleyi]|uniref:Nucleotide-sugar transporter n=1 Tax=Microdochium bolleyi TaxID=196109 RepID=A0A136IUD6_9PEZI|nr:nucleotide-sugar transporter [Microdochium bolleyi]
MALAYDDKPKPLGGPTLMGVPVKHVSLATLTFQNSILILLVHYSRIMTPSGDHRYFTSTAIFLTEVIKLAISLTAAIYEVSRSLAPSTPATVLFEQLYNAVFSGDGWKLAIPATLYTIQNTLNYVALGNLDPVHFQILYQVKILTTAIFTVTMLGRSLTVNRWIALVVLTVGVAIVSIPSSTPEVGMFTLHDMTDHFFPRSMHELGQIANGMGEVANHLTRRSLNGLSEVGMALTKRSATYEGIDEDVTQIGMNYSIGVAAVLVAAVISSLTGVYLEKVLKDPATTASVWTRNIQLSFYSLFPAVIFGIVYKDGEEIAQHGFFDGYNWVVWALIVLQAVGGVLASLCINYADNIARNYATSISLILSFTFSVWFFDFKVSIMFLAGAALVLASTFMYTGGSRRSRPPPIRIASYQKTTIDPAMTPERTNDKLAVPTPQDVMKSMGMSTSRPSSPLRHHSRTPMQRDKNYDE